MPLKDNLNIVKQKIACIKIFFCLFIHNRLFYISYIKEIFVKRSHLIHAETLSNTVIGILLSTLVYYLWGIPFNESILLQIIFFTLSYVRGYLIRTFFSKLEK